MLTAMRADRLLKQLQTARALGGRGGKMIRKRWQAGWQRRRQVTAAWGCAVTDKAVHLVALGVQAPGRWRVLSSLQWPMPQPRGPDDEEGPAITAAVLREALRSPAVVLHSDVRLCALSLPRSRCAQGQALWPRHWAEDEVAAQVQVEAAAALNLSPQALNYDFLPGVSQGALQSWQWAACARSELRPVRQAFRALPLRLCAVEPAETAAQRAWQHLLEGPSTLWSLAVTDWHFERQVPDGHPALPLAVDDHPLLVACGLALAPLQQAYEQNA
jgi:Tfp pilus assembly PilM family ATPase